MRTDQYKQVARNQQYQAGTVTAQLHRAGKSRKIFLATFDTHYETDGLESVVAALRYSANDRQVGRPNPTNIPHQWRSVFEFGIVP